MLDTQRTRFDMPAFKYTFIGYPSSNDIQNSFYQLTANPWLRADRSQLYTTFEKSDPRVTTLLEVSSFGIISNRFVYQEFLVFI